MGKRYKTSEITCQAISGVLKQLMIQKPLERITVAEIMDTCGMRRQHFYYYFTDIYDLLRWTFEKEADRKSTRLNSSHMPKSRMPSSA